MPTWLRTAHPLPARPDLGQLRRQVRELQRGVRAGHPAALALAGLSTADAGFRLSAASRALARHHGFASWPRLRRHVEALTARSWTYAAPSDSETLPERFLRLACLTWTSHDHPASLRAAQDLLAADPALPSAGAAVAAVAGDVDALRAHLLRDRGAATRTTGPHGWSPLLHLASSRLEVPRDRCLAVARLLLDAGADPDDGRFFEGLPTPFTVLACVVGRGEGDQPPHPHADPLLRLLLERGADPDDGQALYDLMFTEDDAALELLLAAGLGRGDGGPWRRRLPETTPAPAVQLRGLLEWAVLHDQRARVELLAAHGVDLAAPLPGGATPVALALGSGHPALAARLRELGAPDPRLNAVEAFVAAALAGDGEAVRAAPATVVAAARAARPSLVVWAAGTGRAGAVELLVAAGWDVDALGRSDLPREQPWQTALHTAVERDDEGLVRRLLALGADPGVRDRRFGATPPEWAGHLGRASLAGLFGEGPGGPLRPGPGGG
ncbi:ankyrin repeat domain-containing protein [Kineococcus sp. R8]|uniref:ankyrin repeat domain-containing protein n=1 Tax=Kineococcus siccus TaxID=2696567 RepID=UPI00141340A8|nr:ankyrin repeat domain-containing protein [Kineococcus siccus]NAZ81358.1 ankyrin repeat domain-containing protein [Kineococcus siccus]